MAIIEERLDTGGIAHTQLVNSIVKATKSSRPEHGDRHVGMVYIVDLLTRMFLPSGYPNSVSPDYLRYQILNALQAFCNSLAGMLSSRAILQGFGVGDPTASATKALLLTVLQDVFGRLTTILSAHLIGSSLYPEAKTYRLLADVLNDTAVILDTLSPFFNTFSIPGLRVASLCLSAIFKSLCSICAGGSKAAIAVHFATPISGKGDVGDLNAKDASKETVLALFGMLLGTLIVPYVSSPLSTHILLFILVCLHLGINYIGVRLLILRSLNRQRLAIAWQMFDDSVKGHAPEPSEVAPLERIFDFSDFVYDVTSGSPLGRISIGCSFSHRVQGVFPPSVFSLFTEERYVIWFEASCLCSTDDGDVVIVGPTVRVNIFLKEGCTEQDQLRAWIHAVNVCRLTQKPPRKLSAMTVLKDAHSSMSLRYQTFMKKMQAAHWKTDDIAIMVGSPVSVIADINLEKHSIEDKKTR
ncbi:RUS family member 1 [Psilocybe cubensis]|uniref:RUS family member 1 n=1 Tax=Psilocybe cubensis TaxID=181762 RepID=A0ACB8GPH4_PSICU|nr:RUS family member 1 [Psilocybe cubensis]KAH9477375.1 RUS family member 1 [Psilocybe cubensis]